VKARHVIAAVIPARLKQPIVGCVIDRFSARSAFEMQNRRARFVATAEPFAHSFKTQIDVLRTVEKRLLKFADRSEAERARARRRR